MKYNDIPVVILCGGYGTRMKEETEFRPKPLVTIGGIPMILHIMNIYYSFGFKKFILPLGYKGKMIKDYFLNYKYSGDFNIKIKRGEENEISYMDSAHINEFDITFVETGIKTQTGSRIKMIREHISSVHDTFMLTYGDGVSDINIINLLDYHFSHGKVATITGVEEPFNYGELFERDGLVIRFSEKDECTPRLVNGGFYVLNNKFLDYIGDGPDCKLENEPLQRATADKELMIYMHNGNWACADMLREIDRLNEVYDKGEAFWIR